MVAVINVVADPAMDVAAAVVFVKTIASMVTVAVVTARADMVAVVAVINVAAGSAIAVAASAVFVTTITCMVTVANMAAVDSCC